LKSILNIFYDVIPEIDTQTNHTVLQQEDAGGDEAETTSIQEAVATPNDIRKYFEEYHAKLPKEEQEQEENLTTDEGRDCNTNGGVKLIDWVARRTKIQTDQRNNRNDIDAMPTFLQLQKERRKTPRSSIASFHSVHAFILFFYRN